MLARGVLAALLLLLTFAPTLAWAACEAAAGGVRRCPMTFNGKAREYFIHVPATGGTPRPLVVVLHGGEYVQDLSAPPLIRAAVNDGSSAMEAGADSLNVMVAYPRAWCMAAPCTGGGVDNFQWNLGPEACGAFGACEDDVGFVNAAIADIKANFSTDASNVAIAGHSGGGFLVFRMFCEVGGNQHATVGWVISATLTAGEVANCTNPTPTRLIIVNGTQDPAVPYTPAPGAGVNCGIGIGNICTNTIGIPFLPTGYAAFQVLALGARGGSRSPDQWRSTNFWGTSLAVDGNCLTTVEHIGARVTVGAVGSGVIAPFLVPRPDGGCYVNDGVAGDAFDGGGHAWPGSNTDYGVGKKTLFFNTSPAILSTVTGG